MFNFDKVAGSRHVTSQSQNFETSKRNELVNYLKVFVKFPSVTPSDVGLMRLLAKE